MKKVLYFLLSLAVVSLASCSNEDEPTGAVNPNNVINVTTEVTAHSRAGYTTETLREFGLIIESGNIDYTYNNVKLNGGPLEGWTSSQVMYWEGQNKSHTILAYAPYKDATLDAHSMIDVRVDADQSTAEAVQNADFIAMKQTGYVPANDLTDGKLVVKMNHLLSKVFIKLTYPEAYAKADGTNPVATMTIEGMKLESKLDFEAWDGTVENANIALNANSEAQGLTPYILEHDAATRTVTYEFISVPQEQAQIGVKFNAGGTPYTWKYDNLKLVAGQALTITLSVDKQGVQLGGDVTVGEWSEGDVINGGKPGEGADPWKIEQLTNYDQWSYPYCCQMLWWAKMDAILNGNYGAATNFVWADGYDGRDSGVFNKFYIVDLGATYWIAGAGIHTGYGDCVPKQCNIYVTNDDYDTTLVSDEIKSIMYNGVQSDNPAEDNNYSEAYKDAIKKVDDYNKTINWTKVYTYDYPSPDCDQWHLTYFSGDFEEETLLKEIKGRYAMVEFVPYEPGTPGVNGVISVNRCEFKVVTERNGEKVVY